jgi:hypothetical protein
MWKCKEVFPQILMFSPWWYYSRKTCTRSIQIIIHNYNDNEVHASLKQQTLVFLWCRSYVSRMHVCPSRSFLCTYIIFLLVRAFQNLLNHALVKVKYGPMHFQFVWLYRALTQFTIDPSSCISVRQEIRPADATTVSFTLIGWATRWSLCCWKLWLNHEVGDMYASMDTSVLLFRFY